MNDATNRSAAVEAVNVNSILIGLPARVVLSGVRRIAAEAGTADTTERDWTDTGGLARGVPTGMGTHPSTHRQFRRRGHTPTDWSDLTGVSTPTEHGRARGNGVSRKGVPAVRPRFTRSGDPESSVDSHHRQGSHHFFVNGSTHRLRRWNHGDDSKAKAHQPLAVEPTHQPVA